MLISSYFLLLNPKSSSSCPIWGNYLHELQKVEAELEHLRRAGRAPGILSPCLIGSNRVRCCAAAVGRPHLVASRDLTNGHANQLSVTLLTHQVNDPLTQSLAFSLRAEPDLYRAQLRIHPFHAQSGPLALGKARITFCPTCAFHATSSVTLTQSSRVLHLESLDTEDNLD